VLLAQAAPAASAELPNGGVVSGSISTAGQQDSYTFTASAGHSVQIRAVNTGNTSFTPRLSLYGPSGAAIVSHDGNPIARIRHTVKENGTYTVVIQDWQAAQTGPYSLYFAKAPGANEGGPLVNGGVISEVIDRGDIDSYTFSAAVGQSVQIRVAATSDSFTPRLDLYGPSGESIAADDGGRVATIRHTVTQNGTFTVVVTDSLSRGYAEAGPYDLYFVQMRGANEHGRLVDGRILSDMIELGDLDSYTFTAVSGQPIGVRVTDTGSSSFTPAVFVYGPSGALLASHTDNESVVISGTVASNGTYTVVVADGTLGALEGAQTGTYTIEFAGPRLRMPNDFDGDSKSDILWRNAGTGDNAIWQMLGTTFVGGALIQSVSDMNWRIAASGDFNRDGSTDILWRNASTGDNAMWLMKGFDLHSSTLLPAVADMTWTIRAVADFDGDGNADILWRNTTTGENAIWLMNGLGVSSASLILQVANNDWIIVGTADFDGDGQADILWRNTTTGDIAVWFMNAFTISSSAVVGAVPSAWTIAGTGDYDGDGKADILWRHTSTGENAIWLMNGPVRQNSALVTTVADPNWTIAGTGDYDGDGRADILWRNIVSGENAIWLMNGFETNSAALIPSVPDQNWELVRH